VQCAGRIGILKQRIALHVVRAPIRGRVAHAAPLKPGAVVSAGTRLCTVVPAGAVRIVSFFPVATSAGRLHRGQPARLRLSAFPWTKYGVLRATVDRVGQEPREGLLRVELSLLPRQRTAIPIQHGLAGLVEVEVEKVSPLTLVLDAAGRFMLGRETSTPSRSAPASP
jgi:multidrug resistance efflux pump